jgi:hypothetical protein
MALDWIERVLVRCKARAMDLESMSVAVRARGKQQETLRGVKRADKARLLCLSTSAEAARPTGTIVHSHISGLLDGNSPQLLLPRGKKVRFDHSGYLIVMRACHGE